MSTVTLSEAQAKLFELVEHLAPGDEVVITKDGQPIAKLVPTELAKPRPIYGRGKGMLVHWVDDDEHLKDFEEYM